MLLCQNFGLPLIGRVQMFYHAEGKVIKVPGLPDTYDWEHFPQAVRFNPKVITTTTLTYRWMVATRRA